MILGFSRVFVTIVCESYSNLLIKNPRQYIKSTLGYDAAVSVKSQYLQISGDNESPGEKKLGMSRVN